MKKIILLSILVLGSVSAWGEISVGDLSARIDALEKSMGGQTPDGTDIGEELETIRRQIKAVNGRCEELEHQLNQMRQQLNVAPPAGPVDRVEDDAPAVEPDLAGLSDEDAVLKMLSEKGDQKEAVTAVRDARTKEAAKNPPTLKANGMAQYDEAMALFKKNELTKAAAAFAEFARANPKDKRVADAFYWQGESHLKKGSFKSAQSAYLEAYKKKGSKANDALFGLGQALAKDNQKAKAKTIWTKLQGEKNLSPELRKKVTEALKSA